MESEIEKLEKNKSQAELGEMEQLCNLHKINLERVENGYFIGLIQKLTYF